MKFGALFIPAVLKTVGTGKKKRSIKRKPKKKKQEKEKSPRPLKEKEIIKKKIKEKLPKRKTVFLSFFLLTSSKKKLEKAWCVRERP